jgi:hypothetical protein
MIKITSFLVLLFFSSFIINGQVPILVSKNISECQTNCPFDEKVSIVESESTLNLRIEKFINCSINNDSEFSFEFKNDTLNLNFEYLIVTIDTIYQEPIDSIVEIVVLNDSIIEEIHFFREEISITETIGMTFCDCYFIIDLSFSNYPFVPKVILVNRKKVLIKENK